MNEELIKLTSKLGRYSDSVALYPDRLGYSWQRGTNTGQFVIPLSKLSPTLGLASGRPPRALRRLLYGLAGLVLAGILFCSVIQESVPLLAPILTLIGFGVVIAQLKYLPVRISLSMDAQAVAVVPGHALPI